MDDEPLWELLRCPLHPHKGRLRRVGKSVGEACLECLGCGQVYPLVDGILDLVPRPDGADAFLEAESRQWDEHAPQYDEKRRHDHLYTAALDAAVRALRPRPGEVILDAGCGTGMAVHRYLRLGVRVIALDLSLESLRRLRRTFQGAPVTLVRGDLRSLPFADAAFDRIMCANALQQLPEERWRRHAAGELARVARDGARVVVTVHNLSRGKKWAHWLKEGRAGSHSGEVRYIYRYEAAEFRALLASALTVERITGAGLPLPYYFKLSPFSRRLERFLGRFQASAAWGHMLVGVCKRPPLSSTDGQSQVLISTSVE